MSAVFYVERRREGLDRRVFRRTPCGALEWAHFAEWVSDWTRARYYGFVSRELPANCERTEV